MLFHVSLWEGSNLDCLGVGSPPARVTKVGSFIEHLEVPRPSSNVALHKDPVLERRTPTSQLSTASCFPLIAKLCLAEFWPLNLQVDAGK